MEYDINKIWESACALLENRLSRDVYDRWIGVIHAKGIEEGVLILEVNNDFYHSWLEENYLPLIKDAVAAVHPDPFDIQIAVNRLKKPSEPTQAEKKQADQDRAAEANAAAGYSSNKGRGGYSNGSPGNHSYSTGASGLDQAFGSPLNAKYTFDNFVVGGSNKFAHAACVAVAQAPAKAYNPLFIYGDSGLGKTHLMQAIGNQVAAEGKRVIYLSCEEFVNQYIEALAEKRIAQFRRKCRNSCDVFLIDDIHFLARKESTQEEFFHTFNALFDSHKQIVMTSDRPASEIPDLEARLVSRFEWGLVTNMEPPDVETRIAILRRKKEYMEVQLDDEAINFLAENIRTNVRRLEGALVRAVSYASVTGIELTPENLEELLKDTIDTEISEALITVQSIQRLVCDYYDITMTDIRSKRRPASIAFPRQVAMYLCRQMTTHSLPHIGEAFSKNHATVLHACRMIEGKVQADPAVRQTLTQLKERLVKENNRSR